MLGLRVVDCVARDSRSYLLLRTWQTVETLAQLSILFDDLGLKPMRLDSQTHCKSYVSCSYGYVGYLTLFCNWEPEYFWPFVFDHILPSFVSDLLKELHHHSHLLPLNLASFSFVDEHHGGIRAHFESWMALQARNRHQMYSLL